MLSAASILRLHDAWNRAAHEPTSAAPSPSDALEELTLLQHQANFDLWHEEDRARTPQAPAELIVGVKLAIDRLNQQRNDFVERIDCLLLSIVSRQNPDAPLHSETPGLIIDRLSILSLKIFHTAEEVVRVSASSQHHDRNRIRLDILNEQRTDLALCLDQLCKEVVAGARRFKLYRQMKMYNDPELNPVLYKRR